MDEDNSIVQKLMNKTCFTRQGGNKLLLLVEMFKCLNVQLSQCFIVSVIFNTPATPGKGGTSFCWWLREGRWSSQASTRGRSSPLMHISYRYFCWADINTRINWHPHPHQARGEQALAGGWARGDDRSKPQLCLPQTQGGGCWEAKVLLTGGEAPQKLTGGLNDTSFSGAREDWPTARAEGAGFHHGGQGEDGQQAVQLTHGHVQRGHHWGDHDTGVLGPQSMVYVKIQN